MVHMPVATLRIWERRYGVAAPATTASGHRLYTTEDVQRLALLKQLTDFGHAIGSIAKLDMAALRKVAATHVRTLIASQSAAAVVSAPWRVAVVGDGLLRRLQSPGLLRRMGRELNIVVSFGSVADAATASGGEPVDALLVQAAGLHVQWLPQLQAAAAALGASRVAVAFGYGAASTCSAFEMAGVTLWQGNLSDHELADVLGQFSKASAEPDASAPESNPPGSSSALEGVASVDERARVAAYSPELPAIPGVGPIAPPRFHPATLVAVAGLSTTISCECPRHVIDLLKLLTEFEVYSAECAKLGPTDADLHAYLQHVAGTARSLFESALERIAVHDGLVLPA